MYTVDMTGLAGSYLDNAWDNFVRTNQGMPGIFAPPGVSSITSGTVAWDIFETYTPLEFVASGFEAMPGFTALETAGTVASAAGANFAAATLVYEGGVAVGSLISAIPIGNGKTVSDGVSQLIENLLSPSNTDSTNKTSGDSPSTPACGG